MLLRQQSTALACLFLKKLVVTSSSLKAERLVVGKGRLRRRNSRLRRPCVRRLARGGSAPGLFQLSPPAARSAAEAVSKVQKMGVVVHSMAHPHEILPRDLGNSAIAVATGWSF